MSESQNLTRKERIQQVARLVAVCLVIGFIWGRLLPLVGQWDAVRAWIDPLKAEGINPDGLYYTDVFTDNRHSR